jgi:hypothetical protein
VWEKLVEILLTKDAFMVIKGAKKTRNGRLAYQLLYAHYLGPNNIGNMAGEAENVLTSARYDGEKRQWNFNDGAWICGYQPRIEGVFPARWDQVLHAGCHEDPHLLR